LNRNPSVGDQLATRTPCRCCEWRCPQVLPDQHPGGASRVHRGGEVLNVFLGQQLRQLRLDRLQLPELADIGKLARALASTVPSSFLVRIRTSITRIVPESTSASSSFAVLPVKLLAPAGNSTTT
jgi:hypothetical protein